MMKKFFKVSLLDKKNKTYDFPIQWLVNYVYDCTEYENLQSFVSNYTPDDLKKAIKAAVIDGVWD